MSERAVMDGIKYRIKELKVSDQERSRVEKLAVIMAKDYLERLPKNARMISGAIAFNCIYTACLLSDIPTVKCVIGPRDRHYFNTTNTIYQDIVKRVSPKNEEFERLISR